MFLEYKKELKDKPFERKDYVGKDGDEVTRKIEKPLTIRGFLAWCAYHESDINRYFYNVDEDYDEYVSTITRIKAEIQCEQIEGGMAGIYNSNLTSRLNGLSDKQEVDVKANVNILNIDPLEGDGK